MTQRGKLSLFIFIDALGWEVLQAHPGFLAGLAPERKPLNTILGYSNGCDPSIISGRLPSDHGYWSSYFYSPDTSPFRPLLPLQLFPSLISDYHKVRHHLSKQFAKWNGYTGYFQLYNVPFDHLPLFDYAEKQSIWVPGGMGMTSSIFDRLSVEKVPYWVDATGIGDKAQFEVAEEKVRCGLSFAYLLLGGLDGLMHGKGTRHPDVSALLNWYEERILSLLEVANQVHDDVALYIFSDHGMHDVVGGVDLQAEVGSLGFHFGEDYTAFYDSTMARFWFHKENARSEIRDLLQGLGKGRWLRDEELIEQGVFFPDRKYGERIFLLDPGLMIAPSFMGRRAIAGMHGYDPYDPQSLASVCSNRPLPQELQRIHHLYHLMEQEAGISREVGAC